MKGLIIQSCEINNSSLFLLSSTSIKVRINARIRDSLFMDSLSNEIFTIDNSNLNLELGIDEIIIDDVQFTNFNLFNNRINHG